ncbi:MAG TPA: hypothetical protein VGK00_00365 [Anaerolineales bacterium]|jgi:hypothetical protein
MLTYQIDPAQKKDTQLFLELPFRLYSGNRQWVPPLDVEARMVLDKKRHPFYRHSEAAFFVCMHENRLVGRLAVLNNKRYNEYNHSQMAFFTLFEAENNTEAVLSLFEAASIWARDRELCELTGPKGFSLLDGMGLLVKGFEHRPAFGIPYNLEYYPEQLEGIGFETESENVSGYLDPSAAIPIRIHEISRRIQDRRGLEIANYHTRWDLRKLIPRLKELYNGALEGSSGTYPLENAEVNAMAVQLMGFADPKLIKVVMKTAKSPQEKDKPVGFLLAYPDVSAALQASGGRLFPWGWLKILQERDRTDWVNINGAGMLDEYRGLGGTAILFSEMQKAISASGQFRHAEIVQIDVKNERMQRELRDLGVNFYKMHRIYRKDLENRSRQPGSQKPVINP